MKIIRFKKFFIEAGWAFGKNTMFLASCLACNDFQVKYRLEQSE